MGSGLKGDTGSGEAGARAALPRFPGRGVGQDSVFSLTPALSRCRAGPKPVLAQAGAEAVDCHGYVLVPMGVDPHDYPGGIEMCDGGHSCLLVLRVGWHPPVPTKSGTGLRRGLWPGSYEVTARLVGGPRWAAPRSSRQIGLKALRRSQSGSDSTRGSPERSSQSQSC